MRVARRAPARLVGGAEGAAKGRDRQPSREPPAHDLGPPTTATPANPRRATHAYSIPYAQESPSRITGGICSHRSPFVVRAPRPAARGRVPVTYLLDEP